GSLSAPKSVVTAPASDFASIVGHLVVASEGLIDPNTRTSKLFDVAWDPGTSKLVPVLITGGDVFQYEAIAFSCACVPSTLSCPASTCLNALSPTVVTYPTPVTTGGSAPGATATCTPPSGSVFGLGSTVVNCTAPDGCGGTAS